jgi:hypothetical protein
VPSPSLPSTAADQGADALFISRAALLVKVTAEIWLGGALEVARIWATGWSEPGLAGAKRKARTRQAVGGFGGGLRPGSIP